MGDDPAHDDEHANRDRELSKRLDRLGARLEERRADQTDEDKKAADKTRGTSGYGQAFRLSSEFVAGVLVGCLLGWAVDQWFGTRPWGLIVFLLLGFAAGVLNVLRAAGLVQEVQPAKRDKGDNRPNGTDRDVKD